MIKALKLKRAIGLPLLVLYGLGNILGAGIYVLIGQIAGIAGYAAPLSFLIAFAVAAFTAFSYMELSSRYPKTAGASVYLHQAFGRSGLSIAVGLLLVGAGMVSAAALARGFAGYFAAFSTLPSWVATTGIIVLLSLWALGGIAQSAKLAATFTLIEILGLGLVIGAGWTQIDQLGSLSTHLATANWWQPGIMIAALLAFYAFIGFEDMIEVAEEVKQPSRTLPRAIWWALVVSAVLYLLVLVSALLVLSPDELARSSAPLADVFARASGGSGQWLAAVGLAAIANGILVQIIMGSRILYGLAKKGWLDASLTQLDGRARTPTLATLIVSGAILVLALTLPLVSLAKITSLLVLGVFLLVNLALLTLKRRGSLGHKHHKVPMVVPALGAATTIGMILAAIWLR